MVPTGQFTKRHKTDATLILLFELFFVNRVNIFHEWNGYCPMWDAECFCWTLKGRASRRPSWRNLPRLNWTWRLCACRWNRLLTFGFIIGRNYWFDCLSIKCLWVKSDFQWVYSQLLFCKWNIKLNFAEFVFSNKSEFKRVFNNIFQKVKWWNQLWNWVRKKN